MSITREDLLRSLETQRVRLADSIVLTPVDSLPFLLIDRHLTAFLHGLYLTDKVRDEAAQKAAVIQFAARDQAALDIDAIHSLFAVRFDAAAASLRLLAGLQAHAATFMALGSIGDTVMLLPEEGGGHFSTAPILRRLGLRTIDLPLDRTHMCVDREASLALAEQIRPDFLFVDRSEGLRYEDFRLLGSLTGPTKIFDASQYVPQILMGDYENPLGWGFDLMLFTLHKSFPGPQKAAIVTREIGDVWQRLLTGLSLVVSSSHAESTYLAGLSLLRDDWLALYNERLVATAILLEVELGSLDVPVVPRAAQGKSTWPSTHHVWIRCGTRDAAFEAFRRLEAANLQTNYRKLPYGLGWGLRLGTSHAVTSGLTAAQVSELAEIIAAAFGGGDPPRLRKQVAALAQRMAANAIVSLERYCDQ